MPDAPQKPSSRILYSNAPVHSVFPNPSTGKFALSPETIKGELSIYNMQGQEIYKSYSTDINNIVDLGSQSKGIYFVKIYDGVAVLTKKIVIQ